MSEMTEEEKKDFESLLETDDELKAELELTRLAIEGVMDQGLRNELGTIHDKLDAGTKQAKQVNMKWYLAAAASVLLVASIFVVQWDRSQVNHQELAEAYFTPYPNLLIKRGDNHGSSKELLEAYSLNDFHKVDSLYEFVTEEEDLITLYAAIAKLAMELPKEAIDLLSPLQQSKCKEQAVWYMSLAYLQLGDIEKSRELLSTISEGQFNYNEAQEILEITK